MEKIKKTNHLQNAYLFIGILLSTISTIIIVCSSYLFIQFLIKPNSLPTIFGVTPQIVMTNDMSGDNIGHIESGDLVFIKKTPSNNIEIKNVVAYIDNGHIMISRVTGIKANGTITLSVKADNVEDEYLVDHSKILGTITQRIACVGGFIFFTQSLIGIIIFIVIPTSILITLLIYDIINKKKLNQKTKNALQENKENKPLPQEETITISEQLTIVNTPKQQKSKTSKKRKSND